MYFLLLNLVFIFSLIGLKIIKRLIEIYHLPPGPWGLPVFGYLPFLRENVQLSFLELAKIYGSVFCLRLGARNLVILNDWPSIKQALSDDALLGRCHESVLPGIVETPSIGTMSGEKWTKHRRHLMTAFRSTENDGTTMEDSIYEEVESFLKEIEMNQANFDNILRSSVVNNIYSFIFGHKMAVKSLERKNMVKMIEESFNAVPISGLFTFLPKLIKPVIYLRLVPSYMKIADYIQILNELVEKKITEHQDKSKLPVYPNYIGTYLNVLEKKSPAYLSDYDLNVDTLKSNTSFLMGSGAETVQATILWMFIYLVKYPEIQEKIRNEIDKTIGLKKVSYEDRFSLPYSMAFINEVLRVATIAAVFFPRHATRDTKIGDYTIKKETLVSANYYAIAYDDKLWSDPGKFDPNRFLSANGDECIRPAHHIPFSFGKRNCPGEKMAYIELFYYLIVTLQHFKLKCSTGKTVNTESLFVSHCKPLYIPSLVFEKLY